MATLMQVPTDKGRYVVCGKWWVQPSLTLVHFAESTARAEPELLLNFIDYGFANRVMTGLAVESLTLPLMLEQDHLQHGGAHNQAQRRRRIQRVQPGPDAVEHAIEAHLGEDPSRSRTWRFWRLATSTSTSLRRG